MNLKIDPGIIQTISQSNQQLPNPKNGRNQSELRESARELEAMYIFEAYKAMRKSVPENGLITKSSGSKMFQEMLDMEMARKAAAGDGMGLGEAIYEQLKHHQSK